MKLGGKIFPMVEAMECVQKNIHTKQSSLYSGHGINIS